MTDFKFYDSDIWCSEISGWIYNFGYIFYLPDRFFLGFLVLRTGSEPRKTGQLNNYTKILYYK